LNAPEVRLAPHLRQSTHQWIGLGADGQKSFFHLVARVLLVGLNRIGSLAKKPVQLVS
jgi:hypothetical protein